MAGRATSTKRIAKRAARPAGPSPVAVLRAFFKRNGYVRRQNPQRREAEGPASYKKGDEVRLVLASNAEMKAAQRALQRLGFHAGRPFPKANQIALPLYGRAAVKRFLELVQPAAKRPQPRRTRRPARPTSGR